MDKNDLDLVWILRGEKQLMTNDYMELEHAMRLYFWIFSAKGRKYMW